MKYLPKSNLGRGVLTTGITLTSYAFYDRFRYNQIFDNLTCQATEIASQPLKPAEKTAKIRIYIAPSFYAKNWFTSYIQPLLYSGGMDYDLVQLEFDQAQDDLKTSLVDSKKQVSNPLRPRSWYEYFRGIPAPLVESTVINSEYNAFVSVGPQVYESLEPGYSLICSEGGLSDQYPRLICIPGKEQTGWSGFPKRIFWAFHQRWIIQELGDALIEIIRG